MSYELTINYQLLTINYSLLINLQFLSYLQDGFFI